MNKPTILANGDMRTRLGLLLTFVGFIVFIVGAYPAIFGLDRSPVIGFLQIAVFLVGLAFICLGGYFSLTPLWNGSQFTILADIGLRLVATGYVIAFASGMADIIGFGTQPLPGIPYFGAWQESGVLLGQAVIGLGFLLLIPFHLPEKPHPTLEAETGDTAASPDDLTPPAAAPSIQIHIDTEKKE